MRAIDHAELAGHWDSMVRTIRPLVQSTEEAEDCVSAALLHCLENPDLQVDSPKAFATTIARRRAYDLARVAERSTRRNRRLQGMEGSEVLDIADGVLDQAEARWLDETARRLLKPQVYRLVELLSEGHDMATASKMVGVPKRTAEGQLLMARRIVKSALAKTLAALGLLVDLCRRVGTAAAPAAVALALALIVVPGYTPAQRGPGRTQTTPPPLDSAVVTTRLITPAPGRASRTPGRIRPNPTGAARAPSTATTRTLVIHEPLKAHTRVGTQDRQSQASGPGGIALDCLKHLQINEARIGC